MCIGMHCALMLEWEMQVYIWPLLSLHVCQYEKSVTFCNCLANPFKSHFTFSDCLRGAYVCKVTEH